MRFRTRPPSANRRMNQVEGPPSVLASGIDADASGVSVAIFSSMRSPSTSVRISGTPFAPTGRSIPPPGTETTASRPSSDKLTSGFPKKEPSGPSTKISVQTVRESARRQYAQNKLHPISTIRGLPSPGTGAELSSRARRGGHTAEVHCGGR